MSNSENPEAATPEMTAILVELASTRADRLGGKVAAHEMLEKWPALKQLEYLTIEWKQIIKDCYSNKTISDDAMLILKTKLSQLSDPLAERTKRMAGYKEVRKFLRSLPATEEEEALKAYLLLPLALKEKPSRIYVFNNDQSMGPQITLNLQEKALYVNRIRIIQSASYIDLIIAQFLLHYIMNLAYVGQKYYHLVEVIVGLREKVKRQIKTQALQSFLQLYDV